MRTDSAWKLDEIQMNCWIFQYFCVLSSLSVLSLAAMTRQLGPEQVAELRQAFNLFDTDRGGNISSKELGYAMRSLGMNPTEKDILDILNEVLVWSGGKILFEKYCSLTRTTPATLSSPSFVTWWELRWTATTTRRWSNWPSGSWTRREWAASSQTPSNISWWI